MSEPAAAAADPFASSPPGARGRDADRWLEMDLGWFDPDHRFAPQLDDLFERVAPLVAGVTGETGIFFNLGWLIDLVTEWTGDLSQPIPTRSRRTAAWAAHGYQTLREFVTEFHAAAARHGLGRLRCGILFVEWAHVVWPPELKIYDFDSDWYERHPELYEPPKSFIGMPDLWPVKRLAADDYPYAAFPDGIDDGTAFADFFGAQWGSFAAATGFDAVLLRDGFCGPMIYTRNGPYGTAAPDDPAVVDAFSDAVRAVFAQVKQAAPDCLVFGYSSAVSPVADWRVGCVDFEALVGDGYIDGWIEQTWGGAWQDWWHQLWKGWTFQTANLLTRGAMIEAANRRRATPCSLYHLVETWDGWEHWDTIHQVPGKLTWGAWAFAHASALTPDGPRPSAGAYVSWMNNGEMDLLSVDDVEWLAGLLDRTEASASALEEVHGPALVYDRATMERLSAERPHTNAGEWVDDQAGLVMKWGVPVLAATRTEWLAGVDADRQLVAQVPSPTDDPHPLLSFASVTVVGKADEIAPAVRERLGIDPTGEVCSADFWVCEGDRDDTPPWDRPYLPDHAEVSVADDVTVHYRSSKTPLLTSRAGWAWWHPTDWSEPFNQFLPKYQLGSTYPAYRVARLLSDHARAAARSHLAVGDRSQPVACHLWRSGGATHLLVGNLESGEFGDARTPRNATVVLSRSELGLGAGPVRFERIDGAGPDVVDGNALDGDDDAADLVEFRLRIAPESAVVYRHTAAQESSPPNRSERRPP